MFALVLPDWELIGYFVAIDRLVQFFDLVNLTLGLIKVRYFTCLGSLSDIFDKTGRKDSANFYLELYLVDLRLRIGLWNRLLLLFHLRFHLTQTHTLCFWLIPKYKLFISDQRLDSFFVSVEALKNTLWDTWHMGRDKGNGVLPGVKFETITR